MMKIMKIIKYDGSVIECNRIEFGTDGKNIIVDCYRLIPLIEVVRIVGNRNG